MSSARHRNIRRKIKEIAIGTVALLTMTVPMLSTSATAEDKKDGFLVTFLVSDLPQIAAKNPPDPNLVNPWGLTTSSTSPFWVSDNNAVVPTIVMLNTVPVGVPTAPHGSTGFGIDTVRPCLVPDVL